jgi:hypothetical protein
MARPLLEPGLEQCARLLGLAHNTLPEQIVVGCIGGGRSIAVRELHGHLSSVNKLLEQ